MPGSPTIITLWIRVVVDALRLHVVRIFWFRRIQDYGYVIVSMGWYIAIEPA